MHLLAYLDDSGSDGQEDFFVLAGYIAAPEVWKTFSTEWTAALNAEPKIKYFKMSQAMGMRDQFSPSLGWTREMRDEKIDLLSRIIAKPNIIQIHGHTRWTDYRHVVSRIPNINQSKNLVHRSPYSLILHRLITEFFLFNAQRSHDVRCDWIFDIQSASEMAFAEHAWRSSKKIIDAEMPQLAKNFATPPIYKDDNDEPPLQAADMLAWSARRVLERGTLVGKVTDAALNNLLIPKALRIELKTPDLEKAFQLSSE